MTKRQTSGLSCQGSSSSQSRRPSAPPASVMSPTIVVNDAAGFDGRSSPGIVTFAFFTCQLCCIPKDRTKENRSLGTLKVGTESTENRLFLANVTMPPTVPLEKQRPTSPRFPPWEAFERRPRRLCHRPAKGPAPETLHQRRPQPFETFPASSLSDLGLEVGGRLRRAATRIGGSEGQMQLMRASSGGGAR